MSDETIRALERRDAEDDLAATERLKTELRRAGRDPHQALADVLNNVVKKTRAEHHLMLVGAFRFLSLRDLRVESPVPLTWDRRRDVAPPASKP